MAAQLDLDAVSRVLEAPAPERAPEVGASVVGDYDKALAVAKKSAAKARLGQGRRNKSADQAVTAVDQQRFPEAAKFAMEALQQDPECFVAYLAGAVALDRMGYLAEAMRFYEEALKRSPQNATIAALLAASAARFGDPVLAERLLTVAIKLEPNDPSHVSNLAGALREQGRFNDAIELLRNQLYLQPENSDLWNTLGSVLQEMGDPEQAVTFLQEAIRLKPEFGRAYHNLGTALTDLGRYQESLESFDLALKYVRSPTDEGEMRHGRAAAAWGVGRLAEGWEDYEARFNPLVHCYMTFGSPRPKWSGEDLRGKRIVFIGEQGVGDEVLYLNACQDVIDAVGPEGRVVVAAEERLGPLLRRTFPSIEVSHHIWGRVGRRSARMPHNFTDWDNIDFWAPLGYMPKMFRKKVSDFPNQPSYLVPDPARVAQFRAATASAEGHLRVGIAWKSLLMTPKRSRYFAPFKAWAPVLSMPGVKFFSLQYGSTAEEEEYARKYWNVDIHRIPDLDVKDDLDGVGAAGAALDLVIAPMNASSNLAAACGGLVWMVHKYGSWTQHGNLDGAPWYPRSRAFIAGGSDWFSMFKRMAVELEALTAQRAAA